MKLYLKLFLGMIVMMMIDVEFIVFRLFAWEYE